MEIQWCSPRISRMYKQEKDQHLDEMLDSLLASYSNAEPRPGMETRILANLSARQKSRKLGFAWLWVSAGAAAVVVIMMAILFNHSTVLPKSPVIAGPVPAPKIKSTPAVSSVPLGASIKARVPTVQERVIETDVRQEVFPSPSPLSEQEKLLLLYLRATPRDAAVALSRSDEPPENWDNDRSSSPLSKPGTPQLSSTK